MTTLLERRIMTALGAWLIVSPFLLGVGGAGRVNTVIVGIVLVTAAFALPNQ